jgi:hypothetical protein
MKQNGTSAARVETRKGHAMEEFEIDDDLRPIDSDRCPNPECRDGGVLVDSMTLYGVAGGEDWAACEVCKGKGWIERDTEGTRDA